RRSNRCVPDGWRGAASCADRPSCHRPGRSRVRARRGSANAGPSLFLPLAADTLGGYIEGMRKEAKSSCLRRLSRIEGQLRWRARMVEEDRYCIDIVTQISAVRAALRRAEEEILEDHVANCVEHAIASGDKNEQRRKVNELIDVLSRAQR